MLRPLRLGMLVALFVGIITVAVAASPFAYVSNSGSGDVLVIDTATNAAAPSMAPPGWRNVVGVTQSPDGSRVYVTNQASAGTLLAFDAATGALIREVPVGSFPFGVAVHPLNGKVYVSMVGNGGKVVVVDPSTFTNLGAPPVMTSFAVASPRGVAFNGAGTRFYVASFWADTLFTFDATTNAPLDAISVGVSPVGVAVSYDGARAYVANKDSNSVSVLDVTSEPAAVIATAPVGTQPIGVTVTPDGERVYVANTLSGTVSVLDRAGSHVVPDVAVGSFPYGISTDGANVYVAVRDSNEVVVIDRATNGVVGHIPANMPLGFGQFVRPLLKVATAMTLGISADSAVFRSSGAMTAAATLVRKDNRAPVAGASVTFTLDATAAGGTAVTGADGVARWSFSPSALDVGIHTVKAAFAESRIGGLTYLASAASADFQVQYTFTWHSGSGTVNAGAAVPVRWSITDANGSYISSLNTVAGITSSACSSSASAGSASSTGVRAATAGSSDLRYDGASNQFMFNWKTDKAWVGQCRQFVVQLTDGTSHSLPFQFK